MEKHVFIGYDAADHLAFNVCVRSLKQFGNFTIHPLYLPELIKTGLYARPFHVRSDGQRIDDIDEKPFSTDFSFSRFLVPALCSRRRIKGPVLFCDPDIMFLKDPSPLFHLPEAAVHCVLHDFSPVNQTKIIGYVVEQTTYRRKNWSSLMVINSGAWFEAGYSPGIVSNWEGSKLHGFDFLPDEAIHGMHEAWNWLEGWSADDIDVCAVHYTNGTPDALAAEGVSPKFISDYRFLAAQCDDTLSRYLFNQWMVATHVNQTLAI